MPQWESPGTTPEQLGATLGMDPAGNYPRCRRCEARR